MKKKVCILNYGSGNVMSVYNMLRYLDYNVLISNSKKEIDLSTHIILPGVGAFSASMRKIEKEIPLSVLEKNVINNKKPFLGICVGMQVLAQTGNEFGKTKGLGWLDGHVDLMDIDNERLPHIGWNKINLLNKENPLLNNCDKEYFYFVHSYCMSGLKNENILSETTHEYDFISSVKKDNIYGVQFHPEKSQQGGLTLFKNFMEKC